MAALRIGRRNTLRYFHTSSAATASCFLAKTRTALCFCGASPGPTTWVLLGWVLLGCCFGT
eukprot:5773878-Lingulodinium_polyedra.AAC.1